MKFKLFKHKEKPVVTAEEQMNVVVSTFKSDIEVLNTRSEMAVSAFRTAANSLSSINKTLEAKKNSFATLVACITDEIKGIDKQIEDNTNVRTKIVEIIGE